MRLLLIVVSFALGRGDENGILFLLVCFKIFCNDFILYIYKFKKYLVKIFLVKVCFFSFLFDFFVFIYI